MGGGVVGYFSNGSEGEHYISKWCDRCQNSGDEHGEIGCAVWDAHQAFNHVQGHKDAAQMRTAAILDYLIPRDLGGLGNGRCRMFREIDHEHENDCAKCGGSGEFAGGPCLCIDGRKVGA